MKNVVIIGGGQAGFSTASLLREQGFEGEIRILGAEPLPPYQRPPLSKAYLAGDMDLDRLTLRPETFYPQQGIELVVSTVVTRIDVTSRRIETATGRLAFDHLVLATGASPIRLPKDIGGLLDGVFQVRSVADIDALKAQVPSTRRLAVVGGGYIGLEAAAVASKLGIEVQVFEASERILQRVACKETSDFFRQLHSDRGVEIFEGAKVAELVERSGRVRAVKLEDGRLFETDAVIVGIGIRPETTLAEAAGIAVDNGIAVDAFCRTSVQGIWAAGDCASFPFEGARVRLESVPNAIDMAGNVARNIMGHREAYRAKPWFWSDQYDVKLQIAGLNRGYDRIAVRLDRGKLSHWYYAGERLVAVDAMNDPRSFLLGRQLIERGHAPKPHEVADPDLDLKALLA